MENQLNRALKKRLMYLENKDGAIDGVPVRIGWMTFSRSGRSVRYRGRVPPPVGGRGLRGNYIDEASGEEFWISGVKRRGSNVHPHRPVAVRVDEDARDAYARLRGDALAVV